MKIPHFWACKKHPEWGAFWFLSNTSCWRLPTFALKRLSSVLQGLTSLFGMGRGVTLATNHQHEMFDTFRVVYIYLLYIAILFFSVMIFRFPNRNRAISTPLLNALLRFHIVPINVIISYDPQTISNLGTGFPLRCFQWLSIPNIATGQSDWRQSPYTRGSFTPVLSY